MQVMLEQNHKLIELMSKQQQQSSEEGHKRKFRDEVNFAVQGPTLLLEPNYRLEDDAHVKLDLSLRQKLRPINADPTTYWVKEAFKRVDRPILGSSLYLEHLMPGFVNEATICKVYDVCAYTEIKNYLTKNAGVDRESQKKLKVKEVTEDHLSMGIQTHWAQANDVWEVMDAGIIPNLGTCKHFIMNSGFNYVAVLFMVRNYSYSGLAMLRCLHEVRYFCRVANGPKQQRTLIESFFNECLKVRNKIVQL